MRQLRALFARLGGLFGKKRKEQELSEEIESHLQMHISDNMRAGMSAEEARRRALIKLGGFEQTKELYRRRRGLPLVDTLFQDLLFAGRMLRKNPGFTAAAVLTLALGIGANSAVFTVVNAALLKDLPVQHPEQLVFPRIQSPEGSTGEFAYTEFAAIRSRNQSFSGIFAFDTTRLLASAGQQTDFLLGQCVSGDFFSVLGVKPVLGRAFTLQDEQAGQQPVVVISYNYWKSTLTLDPHVFEKNISVKNLSFRVVGVAPRLFRGIELGDSVDVWIPMKYWPQVRLNDHLTVGIMGRLKSNIAKERAAAELAVLDKEYAAQRPESSEATGREPTAQNRGIELRSGARGLFDLPDELPSELHILMGVVGLVLLMACVNVANLLLSRGISRKREIALRLALGAGRGRLIRQMLTENMLLAIAGGVLGFLASDWVTSLLLHFASSEIDPTGLDIRPDGRVFWFAAGAAILSGLVFGLLPAFTATRFAPETGLKSVPGSSAAAEARSGLRHSLVVMQVALCVSLLAVAGLMIKSLQNLNRVSPGFRQDHILLVSLAPTLGGYEGARELNLYRMLQEQIGAAPGVFSASLSRFGLLSSGKWNRRIAGLKNGRLPEENARIHCNPVAPQFFETMGIPLLLGRDFNASDAASAPRVAILTEALARLKFPDRDPVGQHIEFVGDTGSGPAEVVGIVRDVRSLSLRGPDATPGAYIPLAQAPADLLGQVTMEIRTAEAPEAAAAEMRRVFRNIGANLPLAAVSTQAAQRSESVASERSLTTLLSLFSVLAVTLASIGLYGVMAYTVARRTHEIGVRMALGAQQGSLLRMVLAKGVRLTLLGVALGLCLGFSGARVLSSNLFGVTSGDPATFSGVALLLTVVALVACYVPARRAAGVDPMVALRYE